MSVKYWGHWIIAATVLSAVFGCEKKENEPVQTSQPAGPGPAEIAAVRDALTRGMQQISLDKLAKTHVGKRCVVTARSIPIAPPPPPLGMARIMGPTTLYAGELDDISADSIKIRAAYPASGSYKYVEIARADIQSVHLGG